MHFSIFSPFKINTVIYHASCPSNVIKLSYQNIFYLIALITEFEESGICCFSSENMQSILVVLAGFLLCHDVQSSTSVDNCRISIDGADKSQTRCKFEYSAHIEPKSVTVVGGGSKCNLRILAVGGGGQRLKDAR